MSQSENEQRQQRLGRALALLRERDGRTREALARALGSGSPAASEIRRWEAGESAPSAVELWRLLQALDLSFADFELELDPEARNPRLREIADQLDALGRSRPPTT